MMEMEERVLNNRYISSVVFPIDAMPGPGPQRGTPTHPLCRFVFLSLFWKNCIEYKVFMSKIIE